MKKGVIILSLLAGVVLSGFALFKLIFSDHGKENTQNDSSEVGNQVEEEAAQRTEAQGKRIDPEEDRSSTA